MPFRILGPKGHLIVRRATGRRVKAILAGLKRRFGHVKVEEIPVQPDYRKLVVHWARWGVINEPRIHYKEVRPMPLQPRLPLTTDCSGFATLCYKLAGAPDPNGLQYNGLGFTGTLLQHGKPITVHDARPGDLVFYGPGTAFHVAVVVEAGPDPLTVSHGRELGPAYVRVSEDNRQPIRYRSYLP